MKQAISEAYADGLFLYDPYTSGNAAVSVNSNSSC